MHLMAVLTYRMACAQHVFGTQIEPFQLLSILGWDEYQPKDLCKQLCSCLLKSLGWYTSCLEYARIKVCNKLEVTVISYKVLNITLPAPGGVLSCTVQFGIRSKSGKYLYYTVESFPPNA